MVSHQETTHPVVACFTYLSNPLPDSENLGMWACFRGIPRFCRHTPDLGECGCLFERGPTLPHPKPQKHVVRLFGLPLKPPPTAVPQKKTPACVTRGDSQNPFAFFHLRGPFLKRWNENAARLVLGCARVASSQPEEDWMRETWGQLRIYHRSKGFLPGKTMDCGSHQ